MIKHLIFIKFKPDVDENSKKKLEEMLSRLPSQIPEIKGYLFGRDILRTERSYDFALVSDFENLEALKTYKDHPEHVKVLKHVKEIAESILAVDFEY